ncbi:hypothetical protein ACIRPQ_29045 [Streptomyces sp. NPDC101213]|uniref:hypothetical protein n=1 Tax=Streptomyces sp. NPDC101213 TaxID=3366130 RepID=UPI00380414C1
MSMSDVAAQLSSILVSALGLVIFRLIARYLPDDPPPTPPAPRKPADGDDPAPGEATP